MSTINLTYKGIDYPLKITEDAKTGKVWNVKNTKLFPVMQTTDRPLSSQIPPVVEEVIDQEWFYAGAGEYTFLHGKRVYNSPGCDTRTKGVVKLAPKITKATINATSSAAVSDTNLGFELGATTDWTDLDGVTNTGGVPRTGTWCGDEVGADAATTFYTELTWSNTWAGKIVTVTAYAKTNASSGTVQLSINDGLVTTTGASVNLTAAYQAVTVTAYLTGASTKIRINAITTRVAGNHVYWDDFSASFTEPTLGSVVKFCDYSGYTYAASGNGLLRFDGTDWHIWGVFPQTITDLAVWGSYLFIAQGTGYKYWYYDGTSFTISTLATGQMEFLADVGGTFWGSSSAYEVKSSTNPINGGSWSSVTEIVNSNTDITRIMVHPDTVFVGTTNGVYEITAASGEPNRIPDLVKETHSKTARELCFWHGKIYTMTGWSSLYEYDDSDYTVTTLSPRYSFPNQGDFDGVVMAMDGDDQFLYAFVDNGTKVEVLCGRWENITSQAQDDNGYSGTTDWWWHHTHEMTLTDSSDNVRAVHFSALPSTRYLHIGCSSTTDGIYYLSPETNMEVAGSLLTPWLYGKYKHVLKTFYSLTVHTENLSATKTITVSYKKEFDSSWTSLGTITSGTSATLYFPDNVTTKRLQLKFVYASDSATTSPHILAFRLRCKSRPFDLESGRITIDESGYFSEFGGMETSWEHTSFREHDKNYYSMTVLSEGLTTSKTIQFKYKVDDDSDWTTHPELFTESPTQTLYFPEGTVGKIMKCYFTLSSPSDTNLTAYIINGEIRPYRRKEFVFSVEVSDNQTNPFGGISARNAQETAKMLREVNDYKKPIALTTFDNEKYNICIDDLSEYLKYDSDDGKMEYIFTIKAHEVYLGD